MMIQDFIAHATNVTLAIVAVLCIIGKCSIVGCKKNKNRHTTN